MTIHENSSRAAVLLMRSCGNAVILQQMTTLNKTRFETIVKVRPDDIDINRHVHSSRYIDYVLAARFDQMERCYKMPIREFLEHGFGWVIRNTFMEYKRPLVIEDDARVCTWIESLEKDSVKVCFEIFKSNEKLSCSGYVNYTLIDIATGRAKEIPAWIVERYSV